MLSMVSRGIVLSRHRRPSGRHDGAIFMVLAAPSASYRTPRMTPGRISSSSYVLTDP